MKIALILVAMLVTGCYWNAKKIESVAHERFGQAGFEIVAKEGTTDSLSGGQVWFLLKRKGSDVYYEAALSYMLSGDLGIYELKTVDGQKLELSNK